MKFADSYLDYNVMLFYSISYSDIISLGKLVSFI